MKIYASLYFSRRHFLFVFIVIHKVGYQETIERSGEEQEKKKNEQKFEYSIMKEGTRRI